MANLRLLTEHIMPSYVSFFESQCIVWRCIVCAVERAAMQLDPVRTSHTTLGLRRSHATRSSLIDGLVRDRVSRLKWESIVSSRVTVRIQYTTTQQLHQRDSTAHTKTGPMAPR